MNAMSRRFACSWMCEFRTSRRSPTEAAELPAVRWKLVNLERLKRANPEKHLAQRDALERLFR